jgi:KDO2-lipid IV(A) lauroyltransferase
MSELQVRRRKKRGGPLRAAANLVAFAAVRAGVAALRAPSLAAARRLGEAAGLVACSASTTRRTRSLDAVAHAFPDLSPAERARIVRRSFQSVLRTFVEAAWVSRLAPAEQAKLVRWEGAEHVERALAAGRGAILYSAHIGNWEVLGAGFELRFGRPIACLAKRLHDRRIDGIAVLTRRRLGMEPIELRGALRAARRRLDDGGAVVAVIDQSFPRGVVVRSFGRPVALSQGPALLAVRSGAALIPYEGISVERGFVIRFHPPTLAGPDDPRRSEGAETIVARMSETIDRMIAARPGEWLWSHRRWRDLPEHGIKIGDPATWPTR